MNEKLYLAVFCLLLTGAVLCFADWIIAKKGRDKVKRWVRVQRVRLSRFDLRQIAIWVVDKCYKILRLTFSANAGFFSVGAYCYCIVLAVIRIFGYALFFSQAEAWLIARGAMRAHPFVQEHRDIALAVLDVGNWKWTLAFSIMFGGIIWLSSGVTGVLLKHVKNSGRIRLMLIYVPLDFLLALFFVFLFMLANMAACVLVYAIINPQDFLARRATIIDFLGHFSAADLGPILFYPSLVYILLFAVLFVLGVGGRAFLLVLSQLFLALRDSDWGMLRIVGYGFGALAALLAAAERVFLH